MRGPLMQRPSNSSHSGKHFQANSFDRWILGQIGKRVAPARASLKLSDGSTAGFAGASPIATIAIHDRRTLHKLALNPAVEFGDAYTDGRIGIEGDLPGFLEAIFRLERIESLHLKLASRWLSLAQNNSLVGSRAHIHHHYDLGNDFYKLWLDSRLVYTCAYFAQPSMSLEDAQLAKLDHVCRKLRLRPGESVVEAGCGWGSLALHMARHYGVRVRAFNISKEQIAYAREQACAARLENQVEFIEDDYRNISGCYDAFVSIGMLEHVGKNHYADLSAVIGRSISKSGRGLLHFIGRNRPRPLNAWIRKRIFPGGHPPTIRESMNVLEPLDMAVCDVENLREHYAWTLEHWLARFETSSRRVAEMFGDPFVRLWRLYLAGSLAGFRAGSMQLFQVLFAGAECSAIPSTRDHLYTKKASADQERKWMHASA
jgi:cyclopropane-fatty-acyl-phospholipid synthase